MSGVAAVLAAGRATLRRSRLVTILLIVLVGVAAGATIAAVAGARRTDSAYPRLIEETNTADVQVAPTVGTIDRDAVERLPQVTRSGRLLAFEIQPQAGFDAEVTRSAFASEDGELFYDIHRLQIIDGRLPRRDRVDEILVNRAFRDEFGLGIGDRYEGVLINYGALLELSESGRPLEDVDLDEIQTAVDLEIVGVSRGQAELIPTEDQIPESTITLSPEFAERYGDHAIANGLVVDLRRGEQDVDAFKAEVRELFPDAVVEFPTRAGKLETVERSVRPYSIALYLFALVVGVAAFLVLGQILARQVAVDAAEVPVLRAIGMSPGQSIGTVIIRSVAVGVASAVLAVVVAALASRLFPFGPAGLAEPHPGFRLDWTVLALGLLVTLLLVVGRAGVTAWRVVRRYRAGGEGLVAGGARPSATARAAARAGVPPAPTTGIRFALERSGVLLGPATTLIGLVAAVAAATASLGFGDSLDRVLSTPRLYGWNWDVVLAGYDGTSDAIAGEVERDDELTRQTDGARTVVRFEDEDLLVLALERDPGHVRPTIIDGRPPRAPDEVALGARTLRDLDVDHGDTVTAEGASRPRRLKVVGTAVLPALTLGETLGLSEGAVLTLDGLGRIAPEFAQSLIAADLVPGTTVLDVRARYEQEAAVDTPAPPSELISYRRVDDLPLVLALVLAGLGAGILSHAAITSTRRRRREVGVLKALGFVRPQVAVAVGCEATTLAALSLLIGLPLGVLVARWGWTIFANQLGVVAEPVVPFPWGVMAVALGALVLALAVAVLPGRSAARTQPAFALRSE
ncbi:MAG: FtsX-like permease family protein [Acidimicrobiia bacterium]